MANRLKLNEMDKVLEYAENHISKQNSDGAVVVLHGALKQLVATLKGEDMNEDPEPDVVIYTAKDCMHSIDVIKEVCAKTLDVTVEDIDGRGRTQDVSLARHCAIYFARKEGYKVLELGRIFNRNHSNISHTTTKIEHFLQCDPDMAAKINLVGKNIHAQN